jgi:integrase
MGTLFIRGCYYSRLLVPSDVRPLLGRREIKKSLRASSYKDAKVLAARWEGRFAELFTYLRQHRSHMKPEQIKRLVQHYVSSSLEEGEAARVNSSNVDDDARDNASMAITDMLEEAESQLIINDFRKIAAEADELLSSHKLTLLKASEGYRRLCRELLKAKQVVLKAELDRMDGKYWTPDAAEYSVRPVTHSPTDLSFEQPRLFSEALRDYFQHYKHRDKRTNKEKGILFTRFVESIGGDKPLHDITKAACVQFREHYSKLPKRISNTLRGKSVPEILVAIEGVECLRVTRRTVNLALDDLRHFFSWAIKHDLFTGKNPVDGIAYEGVKKKSYEPFTDEDLRRLFGSDAFMEQREGKYPERYWLLLILLYTGARREEIAQLGVADVKQEPQGEGQQEAPWYFDITADEEEGGKSLKNAFSKRRVPVHSHLIALGLLDYRERRNNEGSVLLFPPSPKVKGRPTPGDAVGKWFHRVRLAHGVTGRKPLHSFRHTLVTRLAAAGVPQDIREILVGHASDTVHGQTYVHREGIPLALLRSHLEKLDFSGCLKGLPSSGKRIG